MAMVRKLGIALVGHSVAFSLGRSSTFETMIGRLIRRLETNRRRSDDESEN